MLWSLLHTVGDAVSVAVVLVVAFYFFPSSPLRKAVEVWIERRVSRRFDRELEHFRHRLALDAEKVRAEHQRLLHNAALVTEKKHEVYRELYRLMHIANGAVGSLYGSRTIPSFEDYSLEDLTQYMDSMRLPGKLKGEILQNWERDRKSAVNELREAERRVEINRAEAAHVDAWNYFLTNSLYLSDSLTDAAANVFPLLRKILAHAKFPEGGRSADIGKLKEDASENLEQLRRGLRHELRVVEGASEEEGPARAAPETVE